MVDSFVPAQTYTWTVSENVITPSSLVVPAVPRHHCKETDDGEHQRGHDGKRGGGVHGARWPFICERVRNRVRTSVASELNIFPSLCGELRELAEADNDVLSPNLKGNKEKIH